VAGRHDLDTVSTTHGSGLFAVTLNLSACLDERPKGHCDAMSAEENRVPSSNEVSPQETELHPQFSACAQDGHPRMAFTERRCPIV
jgi:hypothetical protein